MTQAFGKFGISIVGAFLATLALALQIQYMIEWFLQPVIPTFLSSLSYPEIVSVLVFVSGINEIFGLSKSKGKYEKAYEEGIGSLVEFYIKGICTILITIATLYLIKLMVGQL